MSAKKGQVGIEFIVSTIIFLVTISYASLTIINSMPVYHDYAATEDLTAKSYQISQELIFNRLTTDRRYVLDQSRINSFQVLCDEDRVLGELGLDKTGNGVDISIATVGGTKLLECKKGASSLTGKKIIIRRYAILNGDIARIEISVV